MTDSRGGRLSSSRFRWLLPVLALPVAIWVVHESQRIYRADWASAAERRQVSAWAGAAAASPSSQEWEAARVALQRSLDITPDDPDLQERVGDLYVVAARRDWADTARRRQQLMSALGYYETAIRLRPTEPQTWAMMTTVLQAMGADPARVQTAWERGRALGPYEGHTQPLLLGAVLADWEGATPAMQQWAKALYDRAAPGDRAAIAAMAKTYGLVFAPDADTKP